MLFSLVNISTGEELAGFQTLDHCLNLLAERSCIDSAYCNVLQIMTSNDQKAMHYTATAHYGRFLIGIIMDIEEAKEFKAYAIKVKSVLGDYVLTDLESLKSVYKAYERCKGTVYTLVTLQNSGISHFYIS